MLKPYAERTHLAMKEVLMNPEAPGPEIHYYMIRGGEDKKNITVWETGTVGGEYIKSYGHYHTGDLSETYRIVQGEGIVLMQKRAKDAQGRPIDEEIEEFKAIRVKEGESVFIPSEMGHLVVNIGKTWLVTVDDSPVGLPGHADYEPVKKLHGFAYYVVEENLKPKLIKNPYYKIVPEADFSKPQE